MGTRMHTYIYIHTHTHIYYIHFIDIRKLKSSEVVCEEQEYSL